MRRECTFTSFKLGQRLIRLQYQPLLLIHAEYAYLKLEFQVSDAAPRLEFQDAVERIFKDIRAALFAISCRGTSLEAMGSWVIARKEGDEVRERWRMWVTAGQRQVRWGEMPEGLGHMGSAETFPDEGEDAFTLLRKQYADSLWGEGGSDG